MDIKTRFEIGQTVYHINTTNTSKLSVTFSVIKSISISVMGSKISINYMVEDNHGELLSYPEGFLFNNINELLWNVTEEIQS